jgi:hypothetical protein
LAPNAKDEEMKVLFLGGPWHNQRHDVTPGRPTAALLPARFTVPMTVDHTAGEAEGSPRPPSKPRLVTYTRRYVRGNGERLPVYVAPDYDGPARG